MKTKVKAQKEGMPLHQWIATGNPVSKFRGCKGVNKNTVNGIKTKK